MPLSSLCPSSGSCARVSFQVCIFPSRCSFRCLLSLLSCSVSTPAVGLWRPASELTCVQTQHELTHGGGKKPPCLRFPFWGDRDRLCGAKSLGVHKLGVSFTQVLAQVTPPLCHAWTGVPDSWYDPGNIAHARRKLGASSDPETLTDQSSSTG